MKVITLSNEKGGVGKTTVAIHLAAGLAVRGQRVLLIDTDAQANATIGLGLHEEPGFYDLLVRNGKWADLLKVVPPEYYEPPNQRAEGMLAVLPGNGESQLIAQKIDNLYIIGQRLSQLRKLIDIVIFDTSPTPSLLHGAIYMATDGIIYPTLCETWSLVGLMKTIRNREGFSDARRRNRETPLETLGVVPMMYREKTVEHSENYGELKRVFGERVWRPVKQGIIWSEATNMRRTVFALSPNSRAAQEAWNIVQQTEEALQHVQAR